MATIKKRMAELQREEARATALVESIIKQREEATAELLKITNTTTVEEATEKMKTSDETIKQRLDQIDQEISANA